MMPIAVMRMRSAAPPKSVTLIGVGTLVQGTGVTSINLGAGAAPTGDLYVAVVMRRSAATTLPAGFTLISSSGPYTFDGGTTLQYTDVYVKTAAPGDSSWNFGQVTAGRLNGQMLVLRGNTGTPVLESQSVSGFSDTSAVAVALPSIASLGDGRFGIAVGSSCLANVSPASTTLSFDNGWTLRSVSTQADNRLGLATKSMAGGASTAGNFTTSVPPATNGMTANALIFASP